MAGKETLWEAAQHAGKLMFIGVHPDDEIIVGPFLAWFADRRGTVDIVSLTSGEAGCNLGRQDLDHTLAEVRQEEFRTAVGILGGTPHLLGYINGLSTGHPEGVAIREGADTASKRWQAIDKLETPYQVITRWKEQNGDPVKRVGRLLDELKPDIVLAFDPETGFTGHEEHVAGAKVALGAVALYGERTGRALPLYQCLPENGHEGLEKIRTAQLVADGGKNYEDISVEAHARYESQYGIRGSEQSERYVYRSRERNQQFYFSRAI